MSDEEIKSAITKVCGWYVNALDGGPFVADETDYEFFRMTPETDAVATYVEEAVKSENY